jgi:holo-[acyl-carrier protein] synthase
MPPFRPAEVDAVRVGVDLVDVERVRRLIAEHPDQLATIWTARERARADGRAGAAQHLAVRFAAKEALLKALGSGLAAGMAWTEIEVGNDPQGRPTLSLSGRVASWAGERGMFCADISLSHTRTTAMAVVLVRTRSAEAVRNSYFARGALCGSI